MSIYVNLQYTSKCSSVWFCNEQCCGCISLAPSCGQLCNFFSALRAKLLHSDGELGLTVSWAFIDPSARLPPNIFMWQSVTVTNLPNKVLQVIFVEKLSFTCATFGSGSPASAASRDPQQTPVRGGCRDVAVKAWARLMTLEDPVKKWYQFLWDNPLLLIQWYPS